MSFCRPAWRKLGPLARRSVVPLCKNVIPARSLAYGLPGGTGQRLAYIVLCGGSLATAGIYAYKTVIFDSEKISDRVANIDAKPKDSSESQPWPAESSPEPAGAPAAMVQAGGASRGASWSAQADRVLSEPHRLESVPVDPMTGEQPDPAEAEAVAVEPAVGAESPEVPSEGPESSPAENDGTPSTGQEVTHPDDGAAMTPKVDAAAPGEA